jgi:MFS superfamily sulfate permease-like transporter
MRKRPLTVFERFCVKVLLFIDYLDMGARNVTAGSNVTYWTTSATVMFLPTVFTITRFGLIVGVIVGIATQAVFLVLLALANKWIKERQKFYADKRSMVE